MTSSLLTVVMAATFLAAPYPKNLRGLPYQDLRLLGKSHRLYWTFDDHPVPRTPKFLAILRKHKIKGTFFVVGYPLYAYYVTPLYKPAEHRLYSILRMVKDGHTLGNHSITHRRLCRLPQYKVNWEIEYTQRLVKMATGITMAHWRPPHGHRCPRIARAVKNNNLTTVMWNVDDYRRPVSKIIREVLARVRSNFKYTVLLFHINPAKLHRFILRLKSYQTP